MSVATSHPELLRLVMCLAPPKDTDPLTAILEALADALHADGCVLWEVHDTGANPPVERWRDRLLALGSWFRNGKIFAVHELRVDNCPTGWAIENNQATFSRSIVEDQRASLKSKAYEQFGLHSLVAAPFRYPDDPETRGAITLYRSGANPPFTEADQNILAQITSAVPVLYQALRARQSLALVKRVSRCLWDRRSSGQSLPSKRSDPALQKTFDDLCQILGEAFHSLEVAVFLEDPLDDPGKYWLIGTIWPRHKLPYLHRTGRLEDGGISNWVLNQKKPIIIFDYLTLEEDADEYRSRYPGFNWSDKIGLIEAAKQHWRQLLPPGSPLPPLSEMSTPIFMGDRLAGVIRCSAGKVVPGRAGPYYFAKRDLDLLDLVVLSISRYWAAFLDRSRVRRETARQSANHLRALGHQLRDTLLQTSTAAAGLADVVSPDHAGQAERVVGLARRGQRLGWNVKILADIDGEDGLKPDLQPLDADRLASILAEAVLDTQVLARPDQGLRVNLAWEPMAKDRKNLLGFQVDTRLLRLAVGNVLDNTAYYSYPDTDVDVRVTTTNTGNLSIDVTNTGLPIRADDAKRLRRGERGYRSLQAQAVRSEGSGIGLFIVAKVMRALNGELEVNETDRQQRTCIRLILLKARRPTLPLCPD
jgi:signal transduction histidine kinase